MRASYEATGGGGVDLEVDVTVQCLISLLTGGSDRALPPGHVAVGVKLQRREGPPGFDDVMMDGVREDGLRTTSFLQIRRSFSFTAEGGDMADFVRAIARRDASAPNEPWYATIVSEAMTPSPKDVRALTDSARRSESNEDFLSRWAAPGASNDGKRKALAAISAAAEAVAEGATWRVFRRLLVVDVDFAGSGSPGLSECLDRLSPITIEPTPTALHTALRSLVLKEARISASYDRATLIEALGPAVRVRPDANVGRARERFGRESSDALASFDGDLGGLCLLRTTTFDEARAVLAATGTLRLVGEAGCGKSMLLGRLCTVATMEVLVIKEDRISARTWREHAGAMGIDVPCRDFVDQTGASGEALLAIDGADRLLLSERRAVLTDMLRAIRESPTRSRWRIATTARDLQAQDLVSDALNALGLPLGRRVEVVGLEDEDVAGLVQSAPKLSGILARKDLGGRNRDLFTLREVLSDPASAGTEVAMATRWATRGGRQIPPCPERDAAISRIADLIVARPDRRIGRADLDAVGGGFLLQEGTIKDVPHRDAFVFTHDIYEDWALARALDLNRERLPQTLKGAAEPLWWIRAVRLAGQIALEASGSTAWRDMVAACTADMSLDPSWGRTLLVAPLYSEDSSRLLDAIEPFLLEDDGKLLERLIETLSILETRPDDRILAMTDISAGERARIASRLPIPLRSWSTFLRWSLPRWWNWPPRLIPSLSTVALVWLRTIERSPQITGRDLVAICHDWLVEIEDARHPRRWGDRRDPFEHHGFEWRELEDAEANLRLCLAYGVRSNPEVVARYLREAAGSRRGRRDIENLLETPRSIPSVLPEEWAAALVFYFAPPHPRVRGDGLTGRMTSLSRLDYGDGGLRSSPRLGASPKTCGFDQLFEADEPVALRLLRRLELRAAVNFRHYMRLYERRTPRPATLRFPWGDVPLWGDANTYRWARGALGPDILASIYMALDLWMGTQAAKGRPVRDLFRLVLRPNGLNATLVACINVAAERVNDAGAIDAIGPILGEPRIWDWEIRRFKDDMTLARQPLLPWPSGDRQAVLAVGARYAGRRHLSDDLLIPFHVLAGTPARDAFRERVAGWRPEDLADFDDEAMDAELSAGLARRLAAHASNADPDSVRLEGTEDAAIFKASIEPPPHVSDEAVARSERHARFEAACRLANWSFATLREGRVQVGFDMRSAVAAAKAYDEPGFFNDGRDDAIDRRIAQEAVAATAVVVVRQADQTTFAEEKAWIMDILLRAAGTKRSHDALFVDSVVLPQDPAVSAAIGLTALRSRSPQTPGVIPAIFKLATDRLHAVSAATVGNVSFARDPLLAEAVARAAFELCLLDLGPKPWAVGPTEVSQRQVARAARALRKASNDMVRGRTRAWPPPPKPYRKAWVFTATWRRPISRRLVPSKVGFDWLRARALVNALAPKDIASNSGAARRLSKYLRSLPEWIRAHSEGMAGDDAGGYFPFELATAAARTMGRLAYLDASRTREDLWRALTIFVRPRRSIDLVGDFLEGMTQELVDSGTAPDVTFWAAWDPASEWIMSHPDNGIMSPRGLATDLSNPVAAAGFVGPYSTPIPSDWAHVGTLLPRIGHWAGRSARCPGAANALFRFCERMTDSDIGILAVDWIENYVEIHGASKPFWGHDGNGDRATAVLLRAPRAGNGAPGRIRRILSTIAEAGSLTARDAMVKVASRRPT